MQISEPKANEPKAGSFSGKGKVALALSLLSLFCFGLTSVPALIVSKSGLRAIRYGETERRDRALFRISLKIAWVSLVLWGLYFIALFLVFRYLGRGYYHY